MTRFLLLLLLPGWLSAQNFDLTDTTLQIAHYDLFFNSGEHLPLPVADSVWQQLQSAIADNPRNSIRLFAYTDDVGSAADNQLLSERRAAAIRDTLLARGIAAERLEENAYGEADPIADNRTEQGRANNRRVRIQLLRFVKLTTFAGVIRDQRTQRGIVAEVEITTPILKLRVRSDTSGAWSARVPVGETATLEVFAEDYFFDQQKLRLLPDLPILKTKLLRIEPGAILELKEFYFIGGSPRLVPKSVPQLQRLLRTLELSYTARIEIVGHVNVPNRPRVGKQSADFQLSVARARTVYDYLLENGISEDRLEFKGMGNWEMVYPEARSAKQQARNRRVEVRVL